MDTCGRYVHIHTHTMVIVKFQDVFPLPVFNAVHLYKAHALKECFPLTYTLHLHELGSGRYMHMYMYRNMYLFVKTRSSSTLLDCSNSMYD